MPNTETSAGDRSLTPPPPAYEPVSDAIEPFARPKPPGPHPLTQRRIWLPLVIVLFVLNIPFIHLWLRGAAPVTATIPFDDDFNRKDLGQNYFATGGFWRIIDGQLYSPGVKNNPLWLKARLPHDVSIEFDARSASTAGDIKCEVFGNGRDHASGYILVFGGWNNSVSIIGRLDEHGKDRKEVRRHVEKDRTYHFKITRQGNVLSWYVDNELLIQWDDPEPLYGPQNDRFGLGTWVTDAYYDNLTIRAL